MIYGTIFAWLTVGPVLLIKYLNISPISFGWFNFLGCGIAYAVAGKLNKNWSYVMVWYAKHAAYRININFYRWNDVDYHKLYFWNFFHRSSNLIALYCAI